MRISNRILCSVCALAVTALLGAAPVFAQAPPQQPPPSRDDQQRAQTPAPVMGELVEVNTDKKMLTVKTADSEVQFAYTDNTEISGGQKGVAGLASAKNARVTVHFTEDAQTKAKTATRIIIQAPKQ